jgi:hypothetical protein
VKKEDCFEYLNGWSVYKCSFAFRKTGLEKDKNVGKVLKDFALPSNTDIPVKIAYAERVDGSAEMVVMRSETGVEYRYLRSNLEKLYGVLKWKKPSFRIMNKNEGGGNLLGIFENGRPIAYLGEYREV